jgi:hypothetical protein
MDALLGPLWSALGAALIAVLGCQWRHRRVVAELIRRVQQAENHCQAASERSTQARLQVRKMAQALAEQTRARKTLETVQRRRAEAAQSLTASARKPARLDEVVPGFEPTAPPPLPPQGFADTQPM